MQVYAQFEFLMTMSPPHALERGALATLERQIKEKLALRGMSRMGGI